MTSTTTEDTRRGVRSALRHPDFRWLVAGLAVSAIGSWAYNVALYVYVYEATQSAAWAAATTLGRFVPSLLFGSYAGVLAERIERRRLLIALDLISTTVMVALGLVAALDLAALLAIALAGVTSMLGTVYYPATAAMTAQVVGEDDLAAANAFTSMVENVSVIAGPALGAAVVTVANVETALLVNAATFLFSAWCSSRIRARSAPSDVTEGGQAGVLKQVTVGFRAIRSSTTARVLVGASVFASFFYGTDTVLFVVFSEDRLGIGADGFGLLMAGLGVGGILMAPVVNRLASRPRLATVISVGLVVYVMPTLLLIWITSPSIAFGLQVVRGAGTLVVDVLAVTALQRSLPSDLIARVFGVFMTLVLAAISLGALVTAPLLGLVGLDGALLVMSAGAAGVVVLAYPWALKVDRATAARLAELEPRIAALEGLGIFVAASRTALERLAAAAEELVVEPGTRIVREGDPADAFYVVADGWVSVSAIGELGSEEHLRTLGPGEYFGEIGLLEMGPRTASVDAEGPVRLHRVPGDEFIAALSETTATSSFMEGARTRLARTHPSRRLEAPALEGAGD